MWKVVGYFTGDTLYKEFAENLIRSLKKFDIPYDVVKVDDLGNWYSNTQYKPKFLREMLKKHYPHSLVYVDVDAIFCKYPEFFDRLDKEAVASIAVHVLDHAKRRRKEHPPEMLSGTIFLKNSKEIGIIINDWEAECKKDTKLWDQVALYRTLKKYSYHILPEEYCVIFDYMDDVKDPVIKHFQASRVVRRANVVPLSISKKRINNQPRKVVRNGMVRIRRSGLV